MTNVTSREKARMPQPVAGEEGPAGIGERQPQIPFPLFLASLFSFVRYPGSGDYVCGKCVAIAFRGIRCTICIYPGMGSCV